MGSAITKLFGILIIIASFVFGWLFMQYDSFLKTPLLKEGVSESFDITPGSSVKSVAQQLKSRGYITSPMYFEVLVRLENKGTQIQAGEYQIDPGMSPEAFLNRVTSGDVKQYFFTIIEGWSFKQMLAFLAEHPQIKHTLAGLNQEQVLAKLGMEGLHPEGWFLPDTYHFPKNTSDVSFLKRAHKAMKAALQQAWEQRKAKLPLKSPYEALILASIIEKETGLASERRDISGVFVRRLNKGMRLQTDPTVIYGMGDRFDGNIRRADLKRDTPYNTYTRNGLPPTPIALPSFDAIQAALDPAPGKSLYFVSKGDGSHYFSATLKEHNQAVRKYQLKK